MIKEQLATIKQAIAESEKRFHREAGSVLLLAVSKKQPVEKILMAYEAGQRHFGENYLQEALDKIAACPKDIFWHFIGKIQSNKINKIANHFAWVHTVDHEKQALKLNDHRNMLLPPLNICLQVNIDQSMTKSGTTPEKIETLANFCKNLPRLRLRGLMSLPTLSHNFDQERHVFHQLWQLFAKLNHQGCGLDTLSIGTSSDFSAAIAEGATIVRIGKKIFL